MNEIAQKIVDELVKDRPDRKWVAHEIQTIIDGITEAYELGLHTAIESVRTQAGAIDPAATGQIEKRLRRLLIVMYGGASTKTLTIGGGGEAA
jgi:hypothetical protein